MLGVVKVVVRLWWWNMLTLVVVAVVMAMFGDDGSGDGVDDWEMLRGLIVVAMARFGVGTMIAGSAGSGDGGDSCWE